MMNQHIFFPEEWSKFSTEKEISWQEMYNREFLSDIPLLYDAAYYNGIETLRPWEVTIHTVPEVLRKWENMKAVLYEKFSIRDQDATLYPMKIGVGLFLEILYWSNGQPVLWKRNGGGQLGNKPVNWEERLEFILDYPKKYHSFIQLTELISEIEKIFIKQQTIMNMKKASKS